MDTRDKKKYKTKYNTPDERREALLKQKREYYWRNLEKFQEKRGTKPYVKIDKSEYEKMMSELNTLKQSLLIQV
jgi:hypothetical protein